MEFGRFCSFENLHKTDIVLSALEAEDLESAAKTFSLNLFSVAKTQNPCVQHVHLEEFIILSIGLHGQEFGDFLFCSVRAVRYYSRTDQ